jgi:hypothetical protein
MCLIKLHTMKLYLGMLYLYPQSMLSAVSAWTAEGTVNGVIWSVMSGPNVDHCGAVGWDSEEYTLWVQIQCVAVTSHQPLIMEMETVSEMLYANSLFIWLITWENFIEQFTLFHIYSPFRFGDMIVQMCDLIWKDPLLWHKVIRIKICTFLQCTHMHPQIQGWSQIWKEYTSPNWAWIVTG